MNITLSERLNGIGEYYFSQKLREIDELNREGKQVINLGIGSPDLPPDATVVNVLQQEAEKPTTHAYQNYKGSPLLRNAIAAFYKHWYGVSLNADSEILPLIGSKEGIMHICMTYLNQGDQVLIPNPGYPTYKAAVMLAGGECLTYDLNEETSWEPDFSSIEAQDLSKVKLMWVNYPAMPTGKPASIELFEKIIAFGKKHQILICHDNPYSFILNEQPLSIMRVEGAKEVALELNSLSKSANMAGWRVGMLVGAADRINEVLRFKSNMDSGMFLPIQLAAAKALELSKDWYKSLNIIYTERRQLAFQLLDLLKCTYDTAQTGMFVWAKVPAHFADGYGVSDKVLYEKNVFLTPGGIFGSNGNNYVRISLCARKEVFQQAIDRISTL